MPSVNSIRLLANWGSKLTVVLALSVVAYDMASPSFALRPIPDDKKLSILLLLVATYVIDASVRQGEIRIPTRRLGKLGRFVNVLEDQADAIRQGIDSERVRIEGRREAVSVLVKMSDVVQSRYLGLNFYAGGWKSELVDLFHANVRAVARGALVRRYFVVMDQLKGTPACKELLEVMENQSREGIDVRYSIESELKRTPRFEAQFLRGGASLYDDVILCHDIHSASDGPDEIELTWSSLKMNERNPFSFLEQAGSAVRRFTEERTYLEQWNSSTPQTVAAPGQKVENLEVAESVLT